MVIDIGVDICGGEGEWITREQNMSGSLSFHPFYLFWKQNLQTGTPKTCRSTRIAFASELGAQVPLASYY